MANTIAVSETFGKVCAALNAICSDVSFTRDDPPKLDRYHKTLMDLKNKLQDLVVEGAAEDNPKFIDLDREAREIVRSLGESFTQFQEFFADLYF